MSVRITAISAAAAALAASAALLLPGQAGAATGELLQPKGELTCGYNNAKEASSKGWTNFPHYRHCGDKKVLLRLENALKQEYVCSPPHGPTEGMELRPMKNDRGEEFYEVVSVRVAGDCGVG
ncbi:hypothetical protein [Allokutzneria albata]|uniref:Secreted protein n=1 Tax=Allokutzneria albata TaxID=211114 RepID=A0A1G9RVM3_ALLAB|nr:hypothetical protein [Allokutzneria albata]SDM27286.1 hypothetical protein SAMN04489726_0718 [Allokutzneria albata]